MKPRVIAFESRPLVRRLILTLAAILAASLLFLTRLEAQESSHVVVVNAANPVTSISVYRVARMFEGKITRWEGGSPVVPIDQPRTSEARKSFSRRVLRKSVTTMENFWQRQIWSGRAEPPLQLENDQEVLDFVSSHPDAIGYVSADLPLGDGLKPLRLDGGS